MHSIANNLAVHSLGSCHKNQGVVRSLSFDILPGLKSGDSRLCHEEVHVLGARPAFNQPLSVLCSGACHVPLPLEPQAPADSTGRTSRGYSVPRWHQRVPGSGSVDRETRASFSCRVPRAAVSPGCVGDRKDKPSWTMPLHLRPSERALAM